MNPNGAIITLLVALLATITYQTAEKCLLDFLFPCQESKLVRLIMFFNYFIICRTAARSIKRHKHLYKYSTVFITRYKKTGQIYITGGQHTYTHTHTYYQLKTLH